MGFQYKEPNQFQMMVSALLGAALASLLLNSGGGVGFGQQPGARKQNPSPGNWSKDSVNSVLSLNPKSWQTQHDKAQFSYTLSGSDLSLLFTTKLKIQIF